MKNYHISLFYLVITILGFVITLLTNEPVDEYGIDMYMLLIPIFTIITLIYLTKLSSLIENRYPMLFDKYKSETPFTRGISIISLYIGNEEFENLPDEEIINALKIYKTAFLCMVASPVNIIFMHLCLLYYKR